MSKPRDLSKLFTSNTNITTDVELFSTVNSASAYALSEANDYTDTAVSSLDAFPEQSGNSGKYLSTTGSAAFWAALNLNAAITTASAAAYSSASAYTDSELASIDLSATIQTASAAAVSYLVDGAPAALNTLNELAAALNDNANILDTLLTTTAASSTYLPLTASASFYRWTKTYSASASVISGVDDNSISLSYNAGYIQLFINGVMLDPSEYTATNGTSITVTTPVLSGEVVDIFAFRNSTSVNTYSQTQIDAKYNNLTRWKKIYSASATVISGNDDNSLPLSYTSGYEQVYLNGILLTPVTDYARTDSSTITLPSAVVTSDIIEIINTQPFNVADVYTTSQANNTFLTQTSASSTYLTQISASATYAIKTDFPADAWISYTPSLTSSGTTPTLGTGSIATGKYKKIGKTVFGWAKIQFGTSGVSAGTGIYRISLPITAAGAESQVCGAGILQDSSANTAYTLVPYVVNTGYVELYQHQTSGATQVVFNDNPINIAASDRLMINFTYEVS